MNTALIANGELPHAQTFLSQMQQFDHIIAVDGGLNYCHQFNLRPDLIIGDFDSVLIELLDTYKNIPKIVFPKNKDQTDLELAIEHCLKSTAKLTIFGALGGQRSDHFLYNLILLSRYPGKVTLKSEKESIIALLPNNKINTYPGQILSLLPLNGPALGVTTDGLNWELKNATLKADYMSLSNVATNANVHISLEKGSLICFIQY